VDIRIVTIHAEGMDAGNLGDLLLAVDGAREERVTARAMADKTIGLYIGDWNRK